MQTEFKNTINHEYEYCRTVCNYAEAFDCWGNKITTFINKGYRFCYHIDRARRSCQPDRHDFNTQNELSRCVADLVALDPDTITGPCDTPV